MNTTGIIGNRQEFERAWVVAECFAQTRRESSFVVTPVTTRRAPHRYISGMKPKHIIYLLGATLAYFMIAVLAARPIWAG